MMPISKKLSQNTSGFTLIELLVVILVIGVLSGVLLSVINGSGVRAKARDSQRKADLIKMQTALELYFTDNRRYPISSIANPGDWEIVNGGDSELTSELNGDYIDPVPTDPSASGTTESRPCAYTGTDYRYNYLSTTGNAYTLTAIMEITTSKDDSSCAANVGCGAVYDSVTRCYYVRNP